MNREDPRTRAATRRQPRLWARPGTECPDDGRERTRARALFIPPHGTALRSRNGSIYSIYGSDPIHSPAGFVVAVYRCEEAQVFLDAEIGDKREASRMLGASKIGPRWRARDEPQQRRRAESARKRREDPKRVRVPTAIGTLRGPTAPPGSPRATRRRRGTVSANRLPSRGITSGDTGVIWAGRASCLALSDLQRPVPIGNEHLHRVHEVGPLIPR